MDHVGRPAPLPANAKLGLFAFTNNGIGNPVAKFDSFTLSGAGTGGGGGTPSGPSYDDQFDGVEPGHRPLERDRPPGRRAHERRGREADADHLAGRHLHR